ncbi:MAG TPA: rhomboid family intramembrane serine protease [Blastocatellia bacterium]|nr:rhomboid family intramembrane serine protease [Blastocatellia bacterium]
MLLPIGDENRGRGTTPVIVYALVGINIGVFLIQLVLGDQFTLAYAAVPYEIVNSTDLVRRVTLPGDLPQYPGPSPIQLTLLTSMFMHGGFLHIGGNMLYLWIFGDNIEDNFGHVKFVVFYLLCGFIASFSQILIDPDSQVPTLGASGAIAGVLGAYLVMFPRNRVRALTLWFILTIVELPAVIFLGIWIVLQFFLQLGSITQHTAQTRGGGVAYMAHIGGFLAGMGLSFLFRRRRREVYWR